MQLPFLTEEIEKGRRVYGGHVSAQRVQPVTAEIWRGASERFGGCEGWYHLEVLQVLTEPRSTNSTNARSEYCIPPGTR